MELRSGTPQEAQVSPSAVENIKQRAESWVEEGIHQGLVLLAARKGIVFLHEAFGQQTPDAAGQPMQLDAIFPISSISKVITAAAAMTLVEDGLLGLNRTVQQYIPEFVGENKEKILVHQLLTHTAGIPGDDKVWSVIEERIKAGIELPPHEDTQHPEIHQFFSYGLDIPLASLPGEIMVYSGYGYHLLGEIIRRLSGKSLDRFAREKLFDLLGMLDSYYSLPEELRSRVVIRPEDNPMAELNEAAFQLRPSPSGGVFSTGMDVARFGQMFLNMGSYGKERVLSPMSVKAMTSNQIPGIGARFFEEIFPEAGWGFGWSMSQPYKGEVYGEPLIPSPTYIHSGAGGVQVWVDQTNELVGVYFSMVMKLRDSGQINEPISGRDLFMNMVTAAVE
jgi:CubicO group peptidase (beta-lactamase class C family)